MAHPPGARGQALERRRARQQFEAALPRARNRLIERHARRIALGQPIEVDRGERLTGCLEQFDELDKHRALADADRTRDQEQRNAMPTCSQRN